MSKKGQKQVYYVLAVIIIVLIVMMLWAAFTGKAGNFIQNWKPIP